MTTSRDDYGVEAHLEQTAVSLSQARVRRARLGLDLLARSGFVPECSRPGAKGLAIPVV